MNNLIIPAFRITFFYVLPSPSPLLKKVKDSKKFKGEKKELISFKNQTLISVFTYTDKKYRNVIPYHFLHLTSNLMYKIVMYKF